MLLNKQTRWVCGDLAGDGKKQSMDFKGCQSRGCDTGWRRDDLHLAFTVWWVQLPVGAQVPHCSVEAKCWRHALDKQLTCGPWRVTGILGNGVKTFRLRNTSRTHDKTNTMGGLSKYSQTTERYLTHYYNPLKGWKHDPGMFSPWMHKE